MMETRHEQIRGDDDMFALLEQMGGGGSDLSSPTTSSEKDSVHENTDNYFTLPQSLKRAFQLSPPTNPEVEIIRHRNHEKFKSDFYDLFRNCVPSSGASDMTGKAHAKHQETPNAQRNECLRSVIHPVWRQMPAHSIWERLQFSLKTLEAGCIRDNQHAIEQPLPWCCIENEEVLLDQLLCPSVQQIYAWTVHGRQHGIVWEPLIPVASISSQDINDPTNQGYRRSSFSLIEEEVKFQFIRSFKNIVGGGREPLPSIDKIYSILKGMESLSVMDGDKKHVVTGVMNEKHAFVLQNIFSSQPFKRILQKLHKKMTFLADETYSKFLMGMKKCAERKAVEEQHQMNKGRKRKGGRGKNGSMPKISLVGEDDDDATTGRKKDDTGAQALCAFNGLSMKINTEHMQKLERLHKCTLANVLGVNEPSCFSRLLFTLLLRYDALEGAGLQSAIPNSVFHFLTNKFGCKFESFASPFNCYERQAGTKFGSAFGDTDAWFGSEGSFFGLDFSKGGCFQANPPFASEFMDSMYERMHYFLSKTNVDDVESPPIQFVIFVPAWAESCGWQSLKSSPYLSCHLIIDQKKHYYSEGTQHRRARRESNGKGNYRIASFDTSVFFLQNAAAKTKWPLDSEELLGGLGRAFAFIEEEDQQTTKEKSKVRKSEKRRTKQADQKKIVKQNQNKRKRKKGPASAAKKKTLVSGEKDEMNIFNSLNLLDKGKEQRKIDRR